MAVTKLYLTAGEPSGDVFAGEVIDALRARSGTVDVRAVGGAALGARAPGPPIDISPLSVLGFWEGMKAYRDVTRISTAIAQDIAQYKPDAAILVDSWGLSIRVAQKVRALDPSIRLIKLIGPQVWATRAGRAKTLAANFDLLLCMHDFEVPYYAPYHLQTRVIGQPALARSERLDGNAFRVRHNLGAADRLLLILPGSRRAEITRVAPLLVAAGRQLAGARAGLKVCIAPAASVLAQFHENFPDLPNDWIVLSDESQRYEAMAAATAALSCSGTVNTELAVQGAPFVTGYRVGRATWAVLKIFLLKAKFITLLNMAANKMVALELVQNDMTVEALVAGAANLLDTPLAREAQCKAQDEALNLMGFGGVSAAVLSADTILASI